MGRGGQGRKRERLKRTNSLFEGLSGHIRKFGGAPGHLTHKGSLKGQKGELAFI